MKKKKSKHGVSPKGAIVLREREQKRRDSLIKERRERVEHTATKTANPLVTLLGEFPVSAVLGKEHDTELVCDVVKSVFPYCPKNR